MNLNQTIEIEASAGVLRLSAGGPGSGRHPEGTQKHSTAYQAHQFFVTKGFKQTSTSPSHEQGRYDTTVTNYKHPDTGQTGYVMEKGYNTPMETTRNISVMNK